MSARYERNNQRGSASLLSSAPDARGASQTAHEPVDAVRRHAIARSRRERKPNPLLAAETASDTSSNGSAPIVSHEAETSGAQDGADRLAHLVSLVRGGEKALDETGEQGDNDTGTGQAQIGDGVPAVEAGHGFGRIAGWVLAGALAGVSLAYALPAGYVATAELLLDPSSHRSESSDAAITLVDNQVRVLQSGTMLGAVADRLNLASDEDFLSVTTGWLPTYLGISSGEPASIDDRRRAVDALGQALDVERVAGSTAIVIKAHTADPSKSALLANTLADLYVAGEWASGNGGKDAQRLETLRAELERAERAIEKYKADNELIDAQGRLISDEQILALTEELSRAKARTVELNARAGSAREANVDSIVTGSLPEQFASPTITDLRDRYAGLKQQADRVAARLGPRHPERLATEAELEGARQQLTGELRRVAGALQTELKRAVQQEQELAAELARMKVRQGQVGEEMVHLRALERDAAMKREAYEDALRGAAGAAASVPTTARILTRAQPAEAAALRPLGTFSMAGALGGLLLGLGLSRWRRGEYDVQRRDDYDAETAEAQSSVGVQARDRVADREAGAASDKENDTMYPYHYQTGVTGQPAQEQPQPTQGYARQTTPQAAAGWQPAPQPMPMAPPTAPMAHAGYPMPPAPAPWPQMMHQAHPYQPFPPVDPWGYPRAYGHPYGPAPAAPPAYAHPAPVFHYHAAPAQQPLGHSSQSPRHEYEQSRATDRREQSRTPPQHSSREAADDRYDHDRFVDERTDAAIEEIRQSLREFRDAIEDLADERFRERDRQRHYGT